MIDANVPWGEEVPSITMNSSNECIRYSWPSCCSYQGLDSVGIAGKSRGYAFIEFEHKNDMKMAYKMADGRKIEGKRVTVDVERGRTVSNWYVLPSPAFATSCQLLHSVDKIGRAHV